MSNKLKITLKGGAGSGHHGHEGRPGEVGGSAGSGKKPKPKQSGVSKVSIGGGLYLVRHQDGKYTIEYKGETVVKGDDRKQAMSALKKLYGGDSDIVSKLPSEESVNFNV